MRIWFGKPSAIWSRSPITIDLRIPPTAFPLAFLYLFSVQLLPLAAALASAGTVLLALAVSGAKLRRGVSIADRGCAGFTTKTAPLFFQATIAKAGADANGWRKF